MITLKETAGDTLIGAVDGVNTEFYVSFDFTPETVQVFVNGRLKVRSWDDGFFVQGNRKVVMKEVPLAGDSLEIEYHSNVHTGGGADGGCPSAPETRIIQPDTLTGEDIPGLGSEELESFLSAQAELSPVIVSQSERPTLFTSMSEED
jgi:hypothetical protein